MSSTRVGVVLFLLFPTALFVVSMRWLFQERKVARQLKNSGKTLEADIVEAGRESFGRSYRLYVTYRFSLLGKNDADNPKHFSRTQSITDKHLRALPGRSTVTVNYLPTDPTISRLGGSDTDHTRQKSTRAFVFLAVCAWCGALCVFWLAS